MFSYTPDQVVEKIRLLTYEEKMLLLTGVSVVAAELLLKMFPDDIFIQWFVETKRESSHK
jgi:hypothetical protein